MCLCAFPEVIGEKALTFEQLSLKILGHLKPGHGRGIGAGLGYEVSSVGKKITMQQVTELYWNCDLADDLLPFVTAC